MPTNAVEQVLSETADFYEARMQREPGLAEEFLELLNAGKKPYVMRLLDNTLKPGKYMLTITVSPQPE